MSHFSVLVITKDPGIDEDGQESEALTQALAPFHEFECTGLDDQYVQNIDELSDARKAFEEGKTSKLRAPDGTLHDPWHDQFYRDPTPEESAQMGPIAGSGAARGFQFTSKDWGDGLGYRAKVRFIPEGFEAVEVSYSEITSFAEYLESEGKPIILGDAAPDLEGEHKYGYARVIDGEVTECIDRTNPNRRWDWYQVGGRWSDRLSTKDGRKVNSARIDELDLEAMRLDHINQRVERIERGFQECCLTQEQAVNRCRDAFMSAVSSVQRATTSPLHQLLETFERCAQHAIKVIGKTKLTREKALELWANKARTIEETRRDYWREMEAANPGSGLSFADWLTAHPETPTTIARDAGVIDAFGDFMGAGVPETEEDPVLWCSKAPAVHAWAILHEGRWVEHGKMGWWGMSTDKVEDWEAQLGQLFDELDNQLYVTLVDCHI